MASAMTVLGPVPSDELGITLMHEHLLIDFRCRYTGSPESDSIGPGLDLRDRWRLIREPAGFEANLLRNDVSVAAEEVAAYTRVGGRTIVDVTTEGLGPDAAALAKVAELTGAHIIASTGMYAHTSHAPSVCEASVADLADRMIRAISEPDAAGLRRGFIGEIGVDGPGGVRGRCGARGGDRSERDRCTGEHSFACRCPPGDPRRRAPGHRRIRRCRGRSSSADRMPDSDGSGDDRHYQDRLLERGVVLEYDTFGFESVFGYKGGFVQLPTDTRRIKEVADLWDRGCGGQVVSLRTSAMG